MKVFRTFANAATPSFFSAASTQSRCAHFKITPPPVMLAKSYKEGQDVSGWYYSEKLDGIRAYWSDGLLTTRNGLVIEVPRGFKSDMAAVFKSQQVDGELFAHQDVFQQTMGAVMQQANSGNERWVLPDGRKVKFIAFDLPPKSSKHDVSFKDRLRRLNKYEREFKQAKRKAGRTSFRHLDFIKYHRLPRKVSQMERAIEVEMKRVLSRNGEGLMVRSPEGLYEAKRSNHLLKVKEVEESEALVVDWEEGTGKHHGLIGSLRCRLHSGVHFEVGSGFSDDDRVNPKMFLKKVITVRHQGSTILGVPRFPIFTGIRLDRSAGEFKRISKAVQGLVSGVTGI
eukprot:TRINITY_DN11797_c7_g1_i1.p1 TRINITY_DN11797_c7_g1~~TRINITY_DN11797_c7_g1_i1.p1  ORF type:complete len:357 (+),score=53.37 TRINITY_DN11797_c7_g1_i1:54-1073(+)